MDDQYLDAFIRESEEAITELNNSLLDLEADPEDRDAMDSIFRTAHTLKGNFGAMGFEDASDLAHAIEDLLDAMRQGELAVTPDRMDLIFAGVDMIEAIVREIEEEGESTTETDEMVDRLRTVLEENRGDASGGGSPGDSAEGGPAGDALSLDADVSVDPGDASERVVRAVVTVGDTDMPGVDAMLVTEAVENEYDLLATDPGRDAIEDGEYGDAFTLFVDAADAADVDRRLSDLGDVSSVETADVTDALAEGAVETAGGASASGDDASSGPAAGSSGQVAAGSGASGGAATDAQASGGTGGDPGSAENPVADASTSGAGDDAAGPAATASGDTTVDEIKSVRVDVDQLDDLHGLIEQLVTSRIKLRRAVETDDLDAASENLNELDKITANLQNTVMDMRLIPLKKVVGKFPRMVRDLARELDKEVEFTIEGEDIELDRTILTEISDPLMHIIRNALDHGIEPPAERERKGKPPTGQVELRASRERDHVIIEVEDDGAGLDVDEIRRKAVEQGVRSSDEIEAMDESAVYDLVFHPGFTTADEVTGTSGRGVGMDVVHDTVTQLDGSVNVESTPDEGTTVSLRLPVTMAIVKVLFVEVGEEEYGVPLKNVDEITRTDEIKRVNGREVIKHNDDIYPVIDLGETFEVPGAHNGDGADLGEDDGILVRIRESERQVALQCDSVNAQEEVVVKPLEGILSGTRGLSGTAVLGDGNIVHILDVVTL